MADDGSVLEELSVCCFPELVETLMKEIPRSLMILGCLQQMARSEKVMSGHVYVSQWPNPDIVVFQNTALKEYLVPFPVVIFASCSTEKLKMTLEKSHLKTLFTSKSGIVGDPRCSDIAIEKVQLNCCEVQVNVAATPHFCALTDGSNLVKHECPPGYYIAPLKSQDSRLVDRMWKFGGWPRSLERLENLITYSLTAGVYCQGTNELVSWAFVAEYGSIGILHTVESHRRRGLAKAVIYHLAITLLNQGKTVFNVIEEENEISRQLFCKMGFTIFPDDLVAFLHIF
ncbi:hypothetical protein ACROYT_G004208 [Oculina patagonica]